jgi:nucleotide-binding universal stress UspA family protein
MSERSILLELDGSAQTRYAAEVAWTLGQAAGFRVDAQHVVDSLAAWDFLAFDIAGFIGSGPYFEAHDSMRGCLSSIGKNLIDVYKQLADKNGIDGEAFLDEGSTIREICFRAAGYDLVVMGHIPTGMQSPNEDKRKLPRRSITETLTHYLPRPMLLVQDRTPMWQRARILLGSGHVAPELLSSCIRFINSLDLELSVRYLFRADGTGSGADRTAPDGLRATADITKSVPELIGKHIDVRSEHDFNDYLKQDAEQEHDTLLVVPVVEANGARKTSFDISPDVMVRYLNHPAVLFWMESAEVEKPVEAGKSVSTAV